MLPLSDFFLLPNNSDKHYSALLVDIKRLTISLNETTDLVHETVSKLLVRVETSELGMILETLAYSKLIAIDDRSRALMHWLAPAKPWDCHEVAMSILKPGTGTWLVQSKTFQAWTETSSAGLWISGFRE